MGMTKTSKTPQGKVIHAQTEKQIETSAKVARMAAWTSDPNIGKD
jgi:hypothetical protein